MYLIQKGIYKFDTPEDYDSVFKRIDEELAEFWYISEAINDRMHNYFITMHKIIEIVWDKNGGDSIVGVGRGSAGASKIAHLLEIIQLDPIKQPVELPFYRFIDRARVELPDVDFDTESEKRLKVFNAVKKYFIERGGDAVNCCTYGKYGSKSAIKTSARGIGISSDEAGAIASLIPIERGFTASLDECYYGNEEKHKKPIVEFVKAVDAHEGLLETAKMIEGVYVSRGVHASGVFLTNEPFTNYSAKMKSPNGIITSQWDLHWSEFGAGLTKYDFLTVSQLSKIRLTMDFLIENEHIQKENTLKETYLKYFSPQVLEYDTEESWKNIHENNIPDLFQFDSLVAMGAVGKIKPVSLIELMQTNSLMRLQATEESNESPVEVQCQNQSVLITNVLIPTQ